MAELSGDAVYATVNAFNYLGDVVFAISGSLAAARQRMDVVGVALIGTITGIGGGTVRDLLLNKQVWWVTNPTEMLLCVITCVATFFFIPDGFQKRKGMIWGDALGLAAFCVVGTRVALDAGAAIPVALFMGMLTATGGGIIRDVLTNTRPMIVSGQLYASVALFGAGVYTVIASMGMPSFVAEMTAASLAFALRAVAIIYDIRLGPRDHFIMIGRRNDDSDGNSGL